MFLNKCFPLPFHHCFWLKSWALRYNVGNQLSFRKFLKKGFSKIVDYFFQLSLLFLACLLKCFWWLLFSKRSSENYLLYFYILHIFFKLFLSNLSSQLIQSAFTHGVKQRNKVKQNEKAQQRLQ